MPNSSGLFSSKRTIILAVVVIVVAILSVVWLFGASGRFVTRTVGYVVDQLVSVSGWNRNLVKGLVILLTIPFFWAVAKYTRTWWGGYEGLRPSLKLYRNPHGIIIVGYVGLFFLSLFFAGRGKYFTTGGQAQRWCAETPEGIRICDAPGVDPVYGIKCDTCTQEQIALLRQQEAGIKPPNRVTIDDPRNFEFLDPLSGRAKVWYWRLPDGSYRFYDGPGRLVKPVDSALIAELIAAYDRGKKEQQETAASEAAATKAREQAAYVGKYINTSLTNRKGSTQTAVLVLDEKGDRLSIAEDEIVQLLTGQGVEAVTNLFRPAFIQESTAKALIGGDLSAGSRLGIGERVDNVIAGTAKISYRDNPGMENLITATLTLDLRNIDAVTKRLRNSKVIAVNGAGFDQQKALEAALRNARPQIEAVLKQAHMID